MKRGQELVLTGWQGGTSGLRVGAETRRRLFLPLKGRIRRVRVVLPGYDAEPCCRVTATFWTTCPELRSAEIGRWMESRGDRPWADRQPPRYSAELAVGSGETAVIRILV